MSALTQLNSAAVGTLLLVYRMNGNLPVGLMQKRDSGWCVMSHGTDYADVAHKPETVLANIQYEAGYGKLSALLIPQDYLATREQLVLDD